MSGIGFFELVILFMIGLVVLGPKRLPKVASQIGSWIGQARRMARVMKRQLEEELEMNEDLEGLKNLRDDLRKDLSIEPAKPHVPSDDDTYSPLHDKPSGTTADVGVSVSPDAGDDAAEDQSDDSGEDGDDKKKEKEA